MRSACGLAGSRHGVHAPGAHPLRHTPPARRTINALLMHTAQTRPGGVLFESTETSLTASELLHRVRGIAAFLKSYDVSPGDRVALMTDNRLETVELLLACSWIGAIFVPFNPALRGQALEHQLTLAEPALLVVDDAAHSVLESDHSYALKRLDSTRVIGWADIALPGTIPKALDKPADAVGPSSVAALLWTSGTTGPSKAVMIPQGQLFWWPIVAAEEMALGPADILYTCLPLFHSNALTTFLQAMVCGGRAILGPKFSVSRYWQRLSEAGATVTYLLGAMGAMLWNRRPETLPNLRLQRVLGGGMSAQIKPLFEDYFGVEVIEGFGMTELGVPIYTPVGDSTVSGMGILHPDFEVIVVNELDEPMPDGVVGELLVRPRQQHMISSGYWRDDRATVESRRNLWFHTGDLVSRGRNQCFTFVGRRTDSIRRRGENISCYEVECALESLPRVAACAAYAVPSELGDDEVMCAVIPAGLPDPQALIAEATPLLASYSLPRYVRFVDELPLTSNGKVRKTVLKEQGVTIDTWDRDRGR